MRVTVGDSGLSCCTGVTYFKRWLTPFCVDSAQALCHILFQIFASNSLWWSVKGHWLNTVISCQSWSRGLFGAQMLSTFMDGRSFFGCFWWLFFVAFFLFLSLPANQDGYIRVNQNLWVIMIDNGWMLCHPCIINIWVSLIDVVCARPSHFELVLSIPVLCVL